MHTPYGLITIVDEPTYSFKSTDNAQSYTLDGIIGPMLFGQLIQTQQRSRLLMSYLTGAALMCAAAVVQAVWGVAAERRALEQVAMPLSQAGD